MLFGSRRIRKSKAVVVIGLVCGFLCYWVYGVTLGETSEKLTQKEIQEYRRPSFRRSDWLPSQLHLQVNAEERLPIHNWRHSFNDSKLSLHRPFLKEINEFESEKIDKSVKKKTGRNTGNIKESYTDRKGNLHFLDMKAVEEDMRRRRRRIKEVCRSNGLGIYASPGIQPSAKLPPVPHYDLFFIDRQDELAWCPVFKAASTSWLRTFSLLGGASSAYLESSTEQIYSIARRLWPPLDYDDVKLAFGFCLKFMVVRHPFERIVSAYRDKLENINMGKEHGVEHFYKKYGEKIVEKYRIHGKTDVAQKRYAEDMLKANLPPPKGVEPTFFEFVKYLINTDLVHYSDDHWLPYYLSCTPCLLDFDVIVKFETLDRDQSYIMKKRRLERVNMTWQHLTKGEQTLYLVKKYFSEITRTELMQLYEKYRLDFELFDYSISEYVGYVQN